MRTGCIVHMGPPVVMHLCTSKKKGSQHLGRLSHQNTAFLQVLKGSVIIRKGFAVAQQHHGAHPAPCRPRSRAPAGTPCWCQLQPTHVIPIVLLSIHRLGCTQISTIPRSMHTAVQKEMLYSRKDCVAHVRKLDPVVTRHDLGYAHIGDLGAQRPRQQHIAALDVQVHNLRPADPSGSGLLRG